MNVNILRNTVAWFGKYSGYEGMIEFLPSNISLKTTNVNERFFRKVIGKILKSYKKWDDIKPSEIFAEYLFLIKARSNGIFHILYLENHLHAVDLFSNKSSLIGTIHWPIRQWSDEQLRQLKKLNNAILLYKEEVEEFAKYIDIDNIHIIKHGVDIDFFKPGQQNAVNKNKVLFVGHFLRNFEMFKDVYRILDATISEKLEYHFIIPNQHRQLPAIQSIVGLKNVFFHQGLSDEELLEFYQTSYVLMMPMNDSGANTAIVQAISVGLPVITTDVGGIRSYGGGDIFPVVENNNSKEMAQLFKKYYDEEQYRNAISEKMRKFAIQELDWNLIARQHAKIYEYVLGK